MKFVTCPICDQVYVKVVDKGNPVVCCDNPIEEVLKDNKKESLPEHIPIIRKIGNFVTISINENHPMIDTHHISVIFIETNQGFQYKNIDLKQEAKAEFILAKEEEIVNVHVYCNVHLISSLY